MMGQRFDLHGQEAYAIGREEGRREALKEAAKAVCEDCADGLQVIYGSLGFWHQAPINGKIRECRAGIIHQTMIAADQGQGQQPDGEERKEV